MDAFKCFPFFSIVLYFSIVVAIVIVVRVLSIVVKLANDGREYLLFEIKIIIMSKEYFFALSKWYFCRKENTYVLW